MRRATTIAAVGVVAAATTGLVATTAFAGASYEPGPGTPTQTCVQDQAGYQQSRPDWAGAYGDGTCDGTAEARHERTQARERDATARATQDATPDRVRDRLHDGSCQSETTS